MPQPGPNASKHRLAIYGKMCAEREEQKTADHRTREIVISVLREFGLIGKPPANTDV